MAKLVLLLLAGFVVYSLVKRYRSRLNTPAPKLHDEDMIRCDHCRIYLPRSEAITTQGKFFCGDAHRREHLS